MPRGRSASARGDSLSARRRNRQRGRRISARGGARGRGENRGRQGLHLVRSRHGLRAMHDELQVLLLRREMGNRARAATRRAGGNFQPCAPVRGERRGVHNPAHDGVLRPRPAARLHPRDTRGDSRRLRYSAEHGRARRGRRREGEGGGRLRRLPRAAAARGDGHALPRRRRRRAFTASTTRCGCARGRTRPSTPRSA